VVPAGMRGIITFLIQHRSMDCLVSTGRRRGHEIMVYQIKDADEIKELYPADRGDRVPDGRR